MGYIIAGLAIAGAGASAYGSSQQASASKDAAKYAAVLEKKFAEDQQVKLDKLVSDKQEKLSNINETLDRFGGGPTAGSQENLDLIRKSQNDFLRIGAGDFGAFEDQLKDIMASTVAETFGSGSPAGTFTQLSAQNIAALRQQGISTGLQTGQALAGDTYNLLGSEFGLMDESYRGQQEIEARKISAISGYQMKAAESAGANYQSAGSFLTSAAGALAGIPGGLINNTSNAPKAKAVPQSVASQYGIQQPAGAFGYSAQQYNPVRYASPIVPQYSPSPTSSYSQAPLPSYSSPPTYQSAGVLPSISAGPVPTGFSSSVPSPYPVASPTQDSFLSAYLSGSSFDPFTGLTY